MPKAKAYLWEIDSPHFNVGLVIVGGVVRITPPIIKYLKGCTLNQIQWTCKRREWKLRRIKCLNT